MHELSLSLLDLGENSFYAEATTVWITVAEDANRNLLTLSLRDDGKGMPPYVLANAFSEGFTTRPHESCGMGLYLFSQTVQSCGGRVILSCGASGTTLLANLPLTASLPLGDMESTLAFLSERGLTVCYRHSCGGQSLSLTLSPHKECLADALEQTAGLNRKIAALGSALITTEVRKSHGSTRKE